MSIPIEDKLSHRVQVAMQQMIDARFTPFQEISEEEKVEILCNLDEIERMCSRIREELHHDRR